MLTRISRCVAVQAAVLCLIILVIALGTAAKHNQFENPAHGTSYLTQSVKMIAGDDLPAVITPEVECHPALLWLHRWPVLPFVSPVSRLAPVSGPLLV